MFDLSHDQKFQQLHQTGPKICLYQALLIFEFSSRLMQLTETFFYTKDDSFVSKKKKDRLSIVENIRMEKSLPTEPLKPFRDSIPTSKFVFSLEKNNQVTFRKRFRVLPLSHE